MDITANNKHRFATKWMNTETVNYTAAYTLCLLVLFAVKQLCKVAFGLGAGAAVGIGAGAAALLSFVLEKKFVFPRGMATVPKQLGGFLFRCAVDFGFYKVLYFLFATLLKREAPFVWLATVTVVYIFNYLFDRLLVFDCRDKAATKSGGRLYKLFFANRFLAVSAFVALLGILFIFIVYSVFPFGDGTVMRMDLYHQYGPLFAELYDRVVEGKSLLYSWESGGGSSFLGNYFNYLSSPFTVLIFLFDKADISFAITALVIVKCMASAVTFTYYLKASQKRHSYVSAAFGVFYAFCAYFLAYYWNIMWIDGMILLPLIVLGIEQLVHNGKGALYTGALAVLLLSNYYMGYMACIFSVLYFLAYFLMTAKPRPEKSGEKLTTREKYSAKNLMRHPFLNRCARFAGFSLLAGGLCAVTLLPTYFLLRGSSATSDSFPTTFESYFTIFDFLTSHLSALETTIRSSGDDVLPNIYCGVLPLLLVPLYLINRRISLREKAVYIVLLLFLLFSFDNNAMNFIWHAFHFPNDLPFRFSYMYCFLVLVMAFRGLCRMRDIAYKDIVFVGLGWLLYVIVAQKFMTTKMSEISIYVTVAFLILWCGLLLCLQQSGFKKSVLAFAVIAMCFSEVIVSDCSSILITQGNSDYKSNYTAYRESIEAINKKDNDFYRTELTYLERRMDPSYYGYNGISTFSSMAYEDYSQLQYNLGMFGNRINSYTYNPQTPVYNMMFNIKYLIATPTNPTPTDRYFTEVYRNKDKSAAVYENDCFLPIAYAAKTHLKDWAADEGDPFKVQGDYFRLATGLDGVFVPCGYTDCSYDNLSGDTCSENGTFWFNKSSSDEQYGTVEVTISPLRDGNVYIYLTSPEIKTAEFSGDGIKKTLSQNIEEPYIMDLGYHKKGEEIKVSLDAGSMSATESYASIYAYSMDETVFAKGYRLLADSALQITDWGETHITGTITVRENSYLCTSIPYDTGWSVYIDGEKAETFKLGEALLTTTVKPGKHKVELRYTPKGLAIGAAVSGTCVAGVAGYLILVHIRRKKQQSAG